jgi:hypothetical protein
VRVLWPYALVAFLYFGTWPFHHGLNNPNEMVRVYMTRAIVKHRTLSIDAVVREWGPVDDKAIRQGRLYAAKAPLQSLVGVPVYRWMIGAGSALDKRTITTRLRRWSSTLPALAFACLLMSWSQRRALALGAPAKVGTALGLSLALGTMLYPYALTFTGHALAAATAGGVYLGAIGLSRLEPRTSAWCALAALTGALAAAAPFAEYPAALVAAPSLLAAVWVTRPENRLDLLGWLAAGAAGPLALGLSVHWLSWGSPLKTAYGFLENRAYIEVHREGLFGVGIPRLESLAGALLSPATGLLFYSPILLVGLVAMLAVALGEDRRARPGMPPREVFVTGTPPLDRRLAVAALVGCLLELLFIAGHRGWRGGWTLGPRYIIPVVPLLGVWTIEALAWPTARWVVPPLAAAAILITGPAAALYPHLSDVYTNPLGTFLWASYREGWGTYGLAQSLGLTGHAANLVHLAPLLGAALYAAFANVSARGVAASLALRRIAAVGLPTIATLGLVLWGISRIGEQDPVAAARENDRLWSFWEPAAEPGRQPTISPDLRVGPNAPRTASP